MTRAEFVAESFRVVPDGGHTEFQVRSIYWDVQEPQERWHTLARMPGVLAISDFTEQREQALADLRYFATCDECGEFNPRGWMHRVDLCQACATKNHGVIY